MLPRPDSTCRASYIEQERDEAVSRALRSAVRELVDLPLSLARLILTGLDQIEENSSDAAEIVVRGSDIVQNTVRKVVSFLGDPTSDVPSFGRVFTAFDEVLVPIVRYSLDSIVNSRLGNSDDPPVASIREEIEEVLREDFPGEANALAEGILPEDSNDCTTSITSTAPSSCSLPNATLDTENAGNVVSCVSEKAGEILP